VLGDAVLFHVNLNVSRLDASRSFYVDGLGFAEGTRTAPERPQEGSAFALDTAWWDAWILTGRTGFDGGALDILQWRAPEPIGHPPVQYATTGYQRLGVGVSDLRASTTALVAAGGLVWSEPIVHSSDLAPEVLIVHASDPDGIGLELFEGKGPQLAFVSVVCADLERSVGWYERLGFRQVARFPSAGSDGSALHIAGGYEFEEVLMRPPGGGAASVMLVGFANPAPIVDAPRAANTLGIWRVAYLVADLDERCAAIRAAGIALLSAPVTMAMGAGLPELRFVCVRGPDGEVLELIERPV
jgi:catechol 2,3-dioxygenase-like lactoylglutathione lyase family enzyme